MSKDMLERMRISLFALLVTVWVPGYSAADEARAGCPPRADTPTPEMMQAGMRNARDHGFMWRISKDGRTSFLYGTIHIAKLDWMYPGPSVMQGLSATDTVALELDMLDPEIQARMTRGIAALHGAALPELLVNRMKQQAESECIPYDSLARLIPEVQIETLGFLVGRRDGLEAAYGIDSVLAGIGHAAKKNMVSLETVELQLRTLQMTSSQETIAFVQDGLDELETGRSRVLMNRMAMAWADGDFSDMAHFDEWCECLKTDIERELMRRMLDERNPGLADSIDELHRSGKRVFAAVGSLHMFGPTGLPALMAKRGYRVERVNFKSL